MSALSDVLYGLGTAFGYGSGDFLARGSSHRIGHVRVLFYMELLSLGILLPLALVLEAGRWHLGAGWLWIAGLGVVNVIASLHLYKAFEYGVLSVVSPLVSSYPAVTAALAFLFLGDRPGLLATAGIVAVLLGILLLTRSRPHPDAPLPRDARLGLLSALISFAGYGVFYFALAYPVSDLGPVTAVAFVRVLGVSLLAGAGLALGTRLDRPPRRDLRILVVIAVLDSFAFLAYNFGILQGSVAVVGTLSGLFSAVTVGMAAIFLRERLTGIQYVGVAAVFLGVVLMAVR